MVVWIAVQWNWRAAFVVTGLLGFVWLILWLLLYRLPENHPRITPEELALIRSGRGDAADGSPDDAKPGRWRDLFKDRNARSLALARMFADPVWWFYVFWLPAYFKNARDFSLEMIGLLVWIPFLTADLGNFVGGGASSYLVKRGVPAVRARKIVMAASAAVMMASIPAALTRSATTALVLISVATLAYSSWGTNVLTLPTDVFRRGAVASATGLSGTGGGIGGMAFTLLTGKVVDMSSYTPIFIMAGIMPLVAAMIIVVGVRARTGGNALSTA
jgi:ACS family hexuronate transporter-like MFS transporter